MQAFLERIRLFTARRHFKLASALPADHQSTALNGLDPFFPMRIGHQQ